MAARFRCWLFKWDNQHLSVAFVDDTTERFVFMELIDRWGPQPKGHGRSDVLRCSAENHQLAAGDRTRSRPLGFCEALSRLERSTGHNKCDQGAELEIRRDTSATN